MVEEKFERPLEVLVMDVEFPQVLDVMDEPAALVQSMLEELFGALYDGVAEVDIIPFILIAGRDCC